ncbi:MAG: hypothetical protein IJF48_04415 [Clostridia bacterium]|nr:hypothetical protein [Clostridia bacterium]
MPQNQGGQRSDPAAPYRYSPCAKRNIGLHLGRAKERGRAREGRKPADDELVVAPLVSSPL